MAEYFQIGDIVKLKDIIDNRDLRLRSYGHEELKVMNVDNTFTYVQIPGGRVLKWWHWRLELVKRGPVFFFEV